MKTVRLKVTQRVTYHREFEMPEAKYAEVQEKLNTLKGRELMQYEERFAETHIDFANDWFDSDDTEIQDFSEVNE